MKCEITTIGIVCDFGSSAHKNSYGKKQIYENLHLVCKNEILLAYLIHCVLRILRYYVIIWYFPKCMKHGLCIEKFSFTHGFNNQFVWMSLRNVCKGLYINSIWLLEQGEKKKKKKGKPMRTELAFFQWRIFVTRHLKRILI